jgi:hypothetical protein
MAGLEVDSAKIEQLKQFIEAAGGANKDALLATFTAVTTKIQGVGAAATAAGTAATSFWDSLTKEGQANSLSVFGQLKNEFSDIIGEFDNVADGALFMAASVKSISPKIIGALSAFDSLAGISENASNVTAQMSKMTANLKLDGWITEVARAGDIAKNMENQLIMNMSAAGDMSTMLNNLGGDYSQLSNKVFEFTELTADVGSATGLTAAQVGDLANVFQKLPGVLDQTVSIVGDADSKFHMLEAAIKVARGTGQSFADVQDDISKYTQNFGASVQTSLETISRMHSATQMLHMNMKDMKDYVESTGESFKFFGDNSSAALDIMGKFAPALLASKLGPTAVKEIVQGFTKGVADMGVAQRAFLSSQAGIGGGGLKGGLEIEKMLEGGKAGDVVSLLEKSLKQLGGGKILNRDEAIKGGPGAAAQFEFQRQLLQQGPYGQLAKSPQEAAKMLDALSRGERGGVEQKIAGGGEALQDTMKVGTALSDRQNNLFIKMNNEMAKVATFSEINANKLTQIIAGINNFPIAANQMQHQARLRADTNMTKGLGADFHQAPTNILEQVTETAGAVIDDTAIGRLLKGPLDEITTTMKGVFRPKEAEGESEGMTKPEPTSPVRPGAQLVPSRTPQTPASAVEPAIDRRAQQARQEQTQEQQVTQQRHGKAPITNEVIIKVMGKKDVLEIINLQLSKYGVEDYHRITTGSQR